MPSKKIKIECGGAGWGTKISVDGKDLLKEVPGIYGIELGIFVDGVTELKLHQRATPVEFNGKVKLIEVFGKENYCLIDREDIPFLKQAKKAITELEIMKRELDAALEKREWLDEARKILPESLFAYLEKRIREKEILTKK